MNMFESIPANITLMIITGLFVLAGVQAGRIDTLEEKLSICKTNYQATQLLIQSNKVAYKNNIKSYEDAVDDTVKFYDDQLTQIKQFKGDDNETTCHSAKRIFDRFKY